MDAAPSDRPSDASQVERAYREIKAGIVDGRYRPGAPLSEVMLAKAHNMSRTPVRESLTRLWQEHYLDRVAGHGYFVARVTVQLIHETFDVRRVLEGAAAAWAAERATEEEIAQLRHLRVVARMRQTTIVTTHAAARPRSTATPKPPTSGSISLSPPPRATCSRWSSSIAVLRKSIDSCRSACTLVRSNRAPPKLTSPLSKPSSAAIQRRRGLAWKSTSTAAAA